MTCEISESGRQTQPALKEAEAIGAAEEAMCALCGNPTPARPALHYMRTENGRLKDLRVCPACFLKTVMEARA